MAKKLSLDLTKPIGKDDVTKAPSKTDKSPESAEAKVPAASQIGKPPEPPQRPTTTMLLDQDELKSEVSDEEPQIDLVNSQFSVKGKSEQESPSENPPDDGLAHTTMPDDGSDAPPPDPTPADGELNDEPYVPVATKEEDAGSLTYEASPEQEYTPLTPDDEDDAAEDKANGDVEARTQKKGEEPNLLQEKEPAKLADENALTDLDSKHDTDSSKEGKKEVDTSPGQEPTDREERDEDRLREPVSIADVAKATEAGEATTTPGEAKEPANPLDQAAGYNTGNPDSVGGNGNGSVEGIRGTTPEEEALAKQFDKEVNDALNPEDPSDSDIYDMLNPEIGSERSDYVEDDPNDPSKGFNTDPDFGSVEANLSEPLADGLVWVADKVIDDDTLNDLDKAAGAAGHVVTPVNPAALPLSVVFRGGLRFGETYDERVAGPIGDHLINMRTRDEEKDLRDLKNELDKKYPHRKTPQETKPPASSDSDDNKGQTNESDGHSSNSDDNKGQTNESDGYSSNSDDNKGQTNESDGYSSNSSTSTPNPDGDAESQAAARAQVEALGLTGRHQVGLGDEIQTTGDFDGTVEAGGSRGPDALDGADGRGDNTDVTGGGARDLPPDGVTDPHQDDDINTGGDGPYIDADLGSDDEPIQTGSLEDDETSDDEGLAQPLVVSLTDTDPALLDEVSDLPLPPQQPTKKGKTADFGGGDSEGSDPTDDSTDFGGGDSDGSDPTKPESGSVEDWATDDPESSEDEVVSKALPEEEIEDPFEDDPTEDGQASDDQTSEADDGATEDEVDDIFEEVE